MACLLTQGFTIDCINSVGGVKTLYIADFNDLVTAPTITAGAVTAMTLATGKKFWTYKLEKQNASATQSLKKSVENGTVYYEAKYDFNIKKMAVASQNELTLLAQNRLLVIHLDNNGKYWLFGVNAGCDLLTNEGTSGKAFGDLNGYTASITGMEAAMWYEVPSAIIATLTVPAT